MNPIGEFTIKDRFAMENGERVEQLLSTMVIKETDRDVLRKQTTYTAYSNSFEYVAGDNIPTYELCYNVNKDEYYFVRCTKQGE